MTYTAVKIRTLDCIGCTKCLPVCPVDALIGAPEQMHAVLTEYCIGCNLCLPVCPTQCIEVIPLSLTPTERRQQAQLAKKRYQAKKWRMTTKALAKIAADSAAMPQTPQEMQLLLNAAIARAKYKRQQNQGVDIIKGNFDEPS